MFTGTIPLYWFHSWARETCHYVVNPIYAGTLGSNRDGGGTESASILILISYLGWAPYCERKGGTGAELQKLHSF